MFFISRLIVLEQHVLVICNWAGFFSRPFFLDVFNNGVIAIIDRHFSFGASDIKNVEIFLRHIKCPRKVPEDSNTA